MSVLQQLPLLVNLPPVWLHGAKRSISLGCKGNNSPVTLSVHVHACQCSFFLFQMFSVSCSTEVRLQVATLKMRTILLYAEPTMFVSCLHQILKLCPSLHSVSFQDDDPITGGADGRENIRVRKFLSERHKMVPWKPEVISLLFICRFLRGFFQSVHHVL